MNATVRVKVPGTVLDGIEFKNCTLVVDADDVTVKYCSFSFDSVTERLFGALQQVRLAGAYEDTGC